MSFGNGAPGGVPVDARTIFTDRRQYDLIEANSGFTRLARPGDSPYDRVIQATPGLLRRFRLGDSVSGLATDWYESAGPENLKASGSVSVAPGLIPCSRDKAVRLTAAGSGILTGQSYHADSPGGNHEIYSIEAWFKPDTLAANTALVGQWNGSGWMVLMATAEIRIYAGATHLDATGQLVAGTTYHFVGVCAGCDAPSIIYLNGRAVATSASGALCTTALNNTTPDLFEIGNYANHTAGYFDGVIQEIAMYSRMLQPAEVLQHYNAAFTRL